MLSRTKNQLNRRISSKMANSSSAAVLVVGGSTARGPLHEIMHQVGGTAGRLSEPLSSEVCGPSRSYFHPFYLLYKQVKHLFFVVL